MARLDRAVRVILLYGSDTSAAADLAQSVRQGVGGDEVQIAAATLGGDPMALVAAASEIPMFGGGRVVRVDGSGEEVLPAVRLLLNAAAAVTLVVIVAGALKKGSKLVALVEGAAAGLAVGCYLPSPGNQIATVLELASEYGLSLSHDAAAAIRQATGGDRGIVRQELAKLALFLGADGATLVRASLTDVAAVGAPVADADLSLLIDSVAGGQPAEVARQLAEHDAPGSSGIALLRAVLRRFWLLLELRAAVDSGISASSAVKRARPPVFYKEEAAVTGQLARWRTPGIRAALAQLLAVERAVKASGSPGDIVVAQLLLTLSRQAARH